MAQFIRKHHVMTLATLSSQGSWTAHCFYAWLPDIQALVFTSDPTTRHGSELLSHPEVSAGIVLETNVIGRIRGIQLTGRACFVSDPETGSVGETAEAPESDRKSARRAYLLRFPFAAAAKLDLWILYIDYVKMTDNRLGFGKKLEWRRSEP